MEEIDNKPKRYNSHPSGVECWDISDNVVGVFSSIVRYCWRRDYKNGLEDLQKARVYTGRAMTKHFEEIAGSNCFPEVEILKVQKYTLDNDPLYMILEALMCARFKDAHRFIKYMNKLEAALNLRLQKKED